MKCSIWILYKMIWRRLYIVAVYTFEMCNCVIQALNDWNTLIVQSYPSKISWGELGDAFPPSPSSMLLIHYFGAIIQNPGQTWIFYNPDQIYLPVSTLVLTTKSWGIFAWYTKVYKWLSHWHAKLFSSIIFFPWNFSCL